MALTIDLQTGQISQVPMDILSTYLSDDVPFVRMSAPMVRYSKLPFRLLVRQYGVDLAYSPMIMADSFIQSPKARDIEFTTCSKDRPLIVQLASKDPCEFTLATEMLAPYCDGIDLNCGCPQKWALNDGLGASLLKRPERIAEMIRSARNMVPRWRNHQSGQLDTSFTESSPISDPWLDSIRRQIGPFSISAKIRICKSGCRAQGDDSHMDESNLTVELVHRLAKMGVDWIVLHCRTVDQRSSDAASWAEVKTLVETQIKHSSQGTHLPIILNGDVRSLEDAHRAYSETGCHGVMAARGLLKNPRLFVVPNSYNQNPKILLDQWLDLSVRYPRGTCYQNVHQQAYWMLESQLDRTRRLMLHSVGSFAGLVEWLQDYWASVEPDL